MDNWTLQWWVFTPTLSMFTQPPTTSCTCPAQKSWQWVMHHGILPRCYELTYWTSAHEACAVCCHWRWAALLRPILCVITCWSAVGNSSCILEQSGRSNQLDVIPHLSHRLSAFPGTLATSLNGRRWFLSQPSRSLVSFRVQSSFHSHLPLHFPLSASLQEDGPTLTMNNGCTAQSLV